ncbi:MAG: molybdopterin cofactor-binding domain-containing protein [Burkholderiales bacterium]
MSAQNPMIKNPSRRRFMPGAAGLTFGVAVAAPGLQELVGGAAEAATGSSKINNWVTVFTDGTVVIQSPAAEMGQGSLTSLPLIVAEEMDADWSKVRIVAAPPNNQIYGNPAFRYLQYTAGSATVTGYFTNLRQFGAQVRYVLLDNAAQRWGVPLTEVVSGPGYAEHTKSGRRLSYGEIAAFAKVPAQAPEVQLDALDKAHFRLIGKDVPRVDVAGKTNGSAQYSIDVQVPGMVYGAILREPVDRAQPVQIDDREARAVAGVLQIVPLQYGVGVIAESPWAAFKAKQALKVTWSSEARGWKHSSGSGFEAFTKIARDDSKKGVAWETVGQAVPELGKAQNVIEGEYRADYAYHAQMEPLNSVASVSKDGCEIWCGTQSQTIAVDAVAAALGLSADKIKFNGMLLGGGFGRRGNRDLEFMVDSALLSKAVGKPVKVLWTREDDVKNGRFRPQYVNRIRAAVDDKGKIVAWHHRVVSDEALAYMDPVRFKASQGRDNIAMRGTELPTYDIPHRLAEGLQQPTGIRTAPLRAIGVGQNSFANEVFIDEVAAKLGVDPVEFRIRQLAGTPRAQRGRDVLREVARMAEWGRKREGRGLGVAYLDYSGTQLAGIAEVSLNKDGRIRVHDFWCVIDAGVAIQPDNIVAQTESSIVYGIGLALTEHIDVSGGLVQQSNFFDYHVPRMRDIPNIHIKLVQTPNHPTGAGQMATPLVPSAIANAFHQLTGVRLRQQPLLPGRVQQAMSEAGVKFA